MMNTTLWFANKNNQHQQQTSAYYSDASATLKCVTISWARLYLFFFSRYFAHCQFYIYIKSSKFYWRDWNMYNMIYYKKKFTIERENQFQMNFFFCFFFVLLSEHIWIVKHGLEYIHMTVKDTYKKIFIIQKCKNVTEMNKKKVCTVRIHMAINHFICLFKLNKSSKSTLLCSRYQE